MPWSSLREWPGTICDDLLLPVELLLRFVLHEVVDMVVLAGVVICTYITCLPVDLAVQDVNQALLDVALEHFEILLTLAECRLAT